MFLNVVTINVYVSQRLESNFINSISSKATRKMYHFCFKKYREFTNDNLITDSKTIENQIIDFLFSLKNRGLSQLSVKSYFCAIAHFYIMNDIVLNRKKIIKFINTDERKKSKNAGYTTEQIHKLLGVCDERTKVIILIYASTGMRLAALPSLKVGDLILIESEPGIYQITVYQGYKEKYITFCTPECTKVIDSYLQYRIRCGEECKPDAPLIREQFDAADSFRVKHPKHITLNTIAKTLRQKIVRVGLRNIDHVGNMDGSKMRKDIPLIHGFRKFFNTALMNADVNLRFKELLMGHSVKLDDVYYDKNNKKSQAKLLEEYSKAIDYLTINEENRLRKKVEELTPKSNEIQAMRAEVKEWREQSEKLGLEVDKLMAMVHSPSKADERRRRRRKT